MRPGASAGSRAGKERALRRPSAGSGSCDAHCPTRRVRMRGACATGGCAMMFSLPELPGRSTHQEEHMSEPGTLYAVFHRRSSHAMLAGMLAALCTLLSAPALAHDDADDLLKTIKKARL